MPKPRIALCAIVKDDSEVKDFKRCLKSFQGVLSGIYVAVTGTSGEHKKIHNLVKSFGGKSVSTTPQTHPEIYSEIDGKVYFTNFAAARNVSFDLVDEEYDYITWADTDDVITSPEQILLIAERALEFGFDTVLFPYWYACRFAENGAVEQIVIEHLRERLIRPGKFHWVSRLHEVALPKDPAFRPKHTAVSFDPKKNETCVWVHTAPIDKVVGNMERNELILNVQLEEEKGKDPRTIFYLAKIHFDRNTPESLDKAKELLEKYLEMSGWDEERSNALEYIGLIYAKKKDYYKAASVFHKAIVEYPKNHIPYLRLADAYYQLGQVDFGDHWLEVATMLPEPKSKATISNTYDIKLLAATLKYIQAKLHDDLEGVSRWARVRADLMGEDDGLLTDVQSLEALNYAATGVFNIARWMKDYGYPEKIETLLTTLPREIVELPYIATVVNNAMPPKVWGDKEIAYYASFGQAHFEKWSAKSLEKGIGGSETAVIELAKEWVKLGYKVTVFCDCGDESGTYEGVVYKPYFLMNWKDEFNILILWRSAHLLDIDIKAKKLFMDLHDVSSPLDWPKERWEKVDKIFVKSNYHRNNIPDVPSERIEVIGNGIRA